MSDIKDSKPYTFSPFGSEIQVDQKIKIIHVRTKNFLNSTPLKYTGGSQQQQVSAIIDQGDDGNWWVVRGQGTIKGGSQIRLTHLVTGANLHSQKKIKSPASGQQEVSCYGQGGVGDENDFWELRLEDKFNLKQSLDQTFRVGSYFKLKHITSGTFLHSHTGFWTQDSKQEVTAFDGSDANDLWYVWVSV